MTDDVPVDSLFDLGFRDASDIQLLKSAPCCEGHIAFLSTYHFLASALRAGYNTGTLPYSSHFPGMPPALCRQGNAIGRILKQITDYDSVALVRCQ